MSDDSWRFADDTVRRVGRELGAYSGDVTPGVMTRTVTGVARGEELYARPELHRPWRTPSTQRHAEVVVAKEQEIEVLTRKLTELRSQVAISSREIQRLQTVHKSEVQSLSEAKDKTIDELQKKLVDAAASLSQVKSSHESQLKAIKSQHDTEVSKLQTTVKQTADSASELSTVYMRQMEDIKAAAMREVELIQQLSNSRTAELSEELKIANEALRKFQDRHLAAISDLQGEMRRNEARFMDQLKEQEKRFEAMRSSLQGERQVVEVQRDKVHSEKTEEAERLRVTQDDLKNTEQRFRDWNQRVLSDLDQIFEYYSAMIREVERDTALPSMGLIPQQKVTEVYLPPRLASEPVSRLTMDRIVERLYQLTLMKQNHASASQSLLRKIKSMEANSSTVAEQVARTAEEKELQLTRLLSEVLESRNRQERLERALAEAQVQFNDLESRLSAANVRLQFFNDDLASALASPTATVAPPTKDVTFLLLSVEGGNLLWESDPQGASAALLLMNNTVRSKMAQYGAYECFSDGTTMMLAFHDPLAACRFALETQLWLMELPWPATLLTHYNTCEEFQQDGQGNRFLVFRGLRVAMAIHAGDVEMEPTGLPTGVSDSRVHYFGRTIIQALHLASLAVGGQIVVSNPVWSRVKSQTVALDSPVVTDLGDHRITVATRGGSDAPTVSEVITLVQIVPSQLQARKFDRSSMFDARQHMQAAGGVGIAPQLSHIRRSTLTDEVTAMKSRQSVVTKAMETLQDEVSSISTTIEALSVKIREAKVGTHVFSSADLQAQATTLDRLVAKLDVVKSDLSRVVSSQEDVRVKVKSLEDTLAVHSRITMSEDDFRRRIEVANERCNQKIFELNMQHDQRTQQLRHVVSKLEQENHDLRKQLFHTPATLTTTPGASVVGKETSSLKSAIRTKSASASQGRTKPVSPQNATESVGSGRAGTSPTFPDKLKRHIQSGLHQK